MTGTFGGALESQKVQIGTQGLVGNARGEVELEDGVLIIKRIHVVYHLATPASEREKVDKIHKNHLKYCPVYRSICAAITITTELDWQESA
ncbi:MAG: OsmC family protein [Geobacteraceae bacterium]